MLSTREIMQALAQHIEADEEYFWGNPDSDYWHYGWIGTSERVATIAEMAIQEFPGDLVEIGCESGRTTVRLAELARKHDRRVIAVDPWSTKLRPTSDVEYEQFLERTKDYADIIDVMRTISQNRETMHYLRKRPLAFAYVDGEHTHPACLSDIWTVYHAGVIAVDDVLWDWTLLRAFHEGAGDRQKIRHPYCAEGYIV